MGKLATDDDDDDDDDENLKAWKDHYVWLLNAEFPWDQDNLSDMQPIQGPLKHIPSKRVKKSGKAVGP